MATETIDINPRDVIVKDAPRRDLGDTNSLMISMEKYGQLQPIGIDAKNNLIFGERRLEVAIRAGWETIRATRFDDMEEAARAIGAETDENVERKDFTPLEKLAMAERLEALLKPAAEERKRQNLRKNLEVPESALREPSPSEKVAKTREIVAKAVGASHDTLRKTKAVRDAAKKPDAPPKVTAAVKEMERTGKVEPAFQAVQEAITPTLAKDQIALIRGSIHANLKLVVRDSLRVPEIDHKAFAEHLGQAGKILDGKLQPVQPNPGPDAVLTFPCAGKPASWVLTKAQVEEWADLYQAVDVVTECKKALGWVRSNSKKTAKGMPRFLTSWLGRAQDGAKGAMAASGGRDKLTGLKAFVDSERRRGSQHHDVELIEGGGNETPF